MFSLFIFPSLIIALITIYFTVTTRWAWLALIGVSCVTYWTQPDQALFCVIWVSMIKWLPVLYKRY